MRATFLNSTEEFTTRLTPRVPKALRAGEENLPAEIDWTRIQRADSRTQSCGSSGQKMLEVENV